MAEWKVKCIRLNTAAQHTKTNKWAKKNNRPKMTTNFMAGIILDLCKLKINQSSLVLRG